MDKKSHFGRKRATVLSLLDRTDDTMSLLRKEGPWSFNATPSYVARPHSARKLEIQITTMADTDLALHDDVEKVAYKNGNSSDETYPAPQYDKDAQAQINSVTTHHDGFFSAFTPNSFKRNPIARVVTEATDLEGRPLPDQPPAEPALAMKLKPRHLQMIAIGGSIGVLPSKYQQV